MTGIQEFALVILMAFVRFGLPMIMLILLGTWVRNRQDKLG